jgi:hypothetical protein
MEQGIVTALRVDQLVQVLGNYISLINIDRTVGEFYFVLSGIQDGVVVSFTN